MDSQLIPYIFYCFMFILVIGYILTISYSLIKHRNEIKFYTIMMRNGNRISKIAIAFWFLMPVILYQSIFNGNITDGLTEILYAVFAAELGNKSLDVANNSFKYKADKSKSVEKEKLYE